MAAAGSSPGWPLRAGSRGCAAIVGESRTSGLAGSASWTERAGSEPRGIAGLESVHLDVATPSDPDQSTWSRGGSGERNVRLIPAEEPVDILRRTMG